ncbi:MULTISPECIES: hypothetical protein [Aerococcus]|uniref:hypothetical protein n=1 Tax=Aerococcus TaxID=1375 RepID=UPI0018A78EED|nr:MULTISPECIES: hypothetical protein [Aerococcus]MCY3067594.1 hypothetical protein [Aerococcus mictus]MCY3080871.1 hypothetical protein [Aerococcus mictus]MDK8485476.1 hypothetical protein [Aerococcus urinae]
MVNDYNNGLDQIKRELGIQTNQELVRLMNNPNINHPLVMQLREIMKYMRVVVTHGA